MNTVDVWAVKSACLQEKSLAELGAFEKWHSICRMKSTIGKDTKEETKMKNKNRWIGLSVVAAMTATTLGLGVVSPAEASVKGRRNTTIALGAVTAYGLLKKNKKVAIAGGVGTAVAYNRYSKKKKWQKRTTEQRRQAWYQQRYGRNWRTYYRPGS